MENKTVKEPLVHLSKREDMPMGKRWLVRIVAVLLSLVVCAGFIYMIIRMNPVQVYEGIVDGAIGTGRRFWVTIRDALTLLCVSVAVTPAFKMRFWNIGAEGQILMGCVASAALMIYAGDALSPLLLLILMFVCSFLAGMIWGVIPAFFKARWNTNETLFTLMLNYVAMQIVTFCIVFWENPVGSNSVGIINAGTRAGWLPPLFGLDYGWNLLIVFLITLFMYIYMKRTKHGYEIAVVGESENTARYAGINVRKVIIRTVGISGGLAGLAGFILVSGSSHTISTSTAGGRGFTAIIVAWLAKFNVWVMAVISFLLVFMQQGAIQIATKYNLNENASDVITGIILFFIIGCEFFINYKLEFRKKHTA
ncbi:MAG: ABC transporter permease [Eubacterium sp.]|nr:ABC transporter permease [Eubacterium sp.]MDD7209611.1 ABC transporter permease [Lachnospiraceae bacterium]MDY5497978.1 ABC transporter permease [Anaerobutyricum sp.]